MSKCACGCGADLSRLRVDARFASEACRKRLQRRGSTDKARTRRKSRDGRGVRLYLTPEEAQSLALDFPEDWPASLKKKADRLAAR